MANIRKIGYGFALFIISVLMTNVAYTILNALLPIVNAPADANAIGDTFEGIVWLVAIIVWLLGLIIVPAVLYYEGLTEEDEIPKPAKGALGILLFVFGMILTTQAYYLTTTFADLMQTTIQVVIFWLALIFNWATVVLIAPYYLVTDARK